MKFLFSALVLMMTLSAVGCSTDNTNDSVVTTGDVEVEDVHTDATEESDVSDVALDSTEDVATVEEGD